MAVIFVGRMCNFVQNFTQIGQSVVEIYRQKCIFQYDVRVPYQILKFWVLVKYILLWSQTQSATVYRILSKSDYSMFQWNMVIKWFSRWQSYSHFEYSEFEICGIWPWLLSDFMSSYKSSSVAELCPKTTFSNMASVRHLEFKNLNCCQSVLLLLLSTCNSVTV